MRYATVQGEMIDEISNHPEGVSFNRLAKMLHGRVSRIRLLNEVHSLQSEGLILMESDPNHKQKKVIKLGRGLGNVLDKIRTVEDKTFGNPLGDFSNLISTYVSTIISAREDWYKELMRHRLQMYVRRMLMSLEGGMADD